MYNCPVVSREANNIYFAKPEDFSWNNFRNFNVILIRTILCTLKASNFVSIKFCNFRDFSQNRDTKFARKCLKFSSTFLIFALLYCLLKLLQKERFKKMRKKVTKALVFAFSFVKVDTGEIKYC